MQRTERRFPIQQLTFVKKGELQWQDRPDPTIGESHEVLVRPIAVARCDLDLPIVMGETLFRAPFPVGHEFVAEVISVGESVKKFNKLDQVIVPFQLSCGTCNQCKSHLSAMCETVPFASAYGMGRPAEHVGGAVSDIIRVPYADHMLVKIPQGIDPISIASLSDNMVDAYRTVGPQLKLSPGSNVLIVGGTAASISLYAIEMAKLLGASEIHYMDLAGKPGSTETLEKAESMGAKPIEVKEYPRNHTSRFGITVDASASTEGFNCAIRSTSPYGYCTPVSIFFNNKQPIPYMDMYNNGVNLFVGRITSRETIPVILNLIQEKGFKPEKVTTTVANWSDAKEAWMEPSIKLIVKR